MYSKNRWLIARSTLVDCKNTTMKTFFEIMDEMWFREWEHYIWNKPESRLVFVHNGSEIIFAWLDDINKIKWLELWFFYVDEVDDVDQEVFEVLMRRLRNKHTPRRVGFVTSNSEGKNWTYQVFIKWQWLSVKEHKKYYTIRASSLENKYLPEDYIENLLSFNPDKFKRYVLWEFHVFEWQIYDEFDEYIHVIDPIDLSESNTTIWYWHDHGLQNPTAILECHLTWDDIVFVTWEHYMSWQAISLHATTLKNRWEQHLRPTPIEIYSDPAIFTKNQLPTPEKPFPWWVADEYSDHGIDPIRANNEVWAGINRIKELLKNKKIYIFNTCTNLIKEMQNYKWASTAWNSWKEAPIKKNDHAVDALRYAIMTKMPAPKEVKHHTAKTVSEIITEDIRKSKLSWMNTGPNNDSLYLDD